MNFRFEHTILLSGLAGLFLLLVAFLEVLRWKRQTARKIGDPKFVKSLAASYAPWKFLLKFVVLALTFALLVMASANLQRPGAPDKVTRKGVDVVVALDVSNSMLADDIKPSRLERAKQFITKLMARMENDRIGIVLFAGRAYLQMPLSRDQAAAAMYVQNASPDAVPTQGTVIAEALRISSSAFNSKERKYKAVVLISDGEDHDPDAAKTALSLQQDGIMINTVGIGRPEGTPIIDYKTSQARKDAQGNTIITKLNEAELQQLAQTGNGAYIRLDNADDAAKTIGDQLATIEQKASTDQAFVAWQSYFQWFLAAAMVLLLLEMFIPERKMQMA